MFFYVYPNNGMRFVDKKCWRIQGELRILVRVMEGAFKYSYTVFFGAASIIFAADDPVPQPLLGTNPAVNITNVVPVVIAPTNSLAGEVLPIVQGGTNTVLSAEEAEEAYKKKLADAKKKWEVATNNLGIYHLIPKRNPFGLIKPKIEKPKSGIDTPPANVVVPHLAGISMLRSKLRAVLRINPPKGGPAEYKFLEVGDRIWEVEVLKINPPQPDGTGGVVEVKVKNKIHTLELDKNTLASFKSAARSSGSSYRPGSSNSRSSGTSSRNTSSSKGTSSRRPSSSSKGGLREVPRRGGRKQSNLDTIRPIGSDLYELPAFNEVVQKRIIDPLNISTQREIIRGQLSYETPTDLPEGRR